MSHDSESQSRHCPLIFSQIYLDIKTVPSKLSKGARIGLADLKKSENLPKFGIGLGSQILFADLDFPSYGLDQLIRSSHDVKSQQVQ